LQKLTILPVLKTEALVIGSCRLENVSLFSGDGRHLGYRGVTYHKGFYTTLYPFFSVKMPPFSTRLFYLKVNSSWFPIVFSLYLQKIKHFFSEDKKDQLLKIFF